jgi:hypothetical protein
LRPSGLSVATSGGHVHGAVRGFDLTDGRALYKIADADFDVQAVGLSPDGHSRHPLAHLEVVIEAYVARCERDVHD